MGIKRSKHKTGIFSRNPSGYGFVALDGDGGSVFIPAAHTKGAQSGDKVECAVIGNSPKGPSGVIFSILEYGQEQFIGCLALENGEYVVHPMRRDLPYSISVYCEGDGEPQLHKCQLNDWVQAKCRPRDKKHPELYVDILHNVGRGNTITGMLSAISKEYDIPAKYSASTEENAAKIEPLQLEREDCRELQVFTVDPADAKDFDDAISFQPQEDGTVIVGVHIADVACYVRPNTPLDRAAQKRGFTTYLPGKTVGMLPIALSNDLCSLKEGVDRLAHSVFMVVSKKGEVLSSRRTHTLIRSCKRLTFDQVERLLSHEDVSGIQPELAAIICQLGALTKQMRKFRFDTERFLPFTPKEVRVLCGGNPPKITGIQTIEEQGDASNMIEELMLAANVCVAREMVERKIPGLYRNHTAPEVEDLTEVSCLAREILDMKAPKLSRRTEFTAFLKKLSKMRNTDVIMLALLRCMPRAVYGAECIGHYALGKEIYGHFTSPIRRYTDLLVHQQLIAADGVGRKRSYENVAMLAQSCNALEYNNDQASFAMSDRLKMQYIMDESKGRRGSYLECILIKITGNGLALYIPKFALMGFMQFEQLPGCSGRYDVRDNSVVFDHGKRRYRIGDTVFARPLKVDTVRGELLLQSTRNFI